MKIRIFSGMLDSVYRVTVCTEDWSEGDIDLMVQFGEPEVNIGGNLQYIYNNEERIKEFGDEFVRIVHGFPCSRGFDSRDYDGGVDDAVAAGSAWKDSVISRISNAVSDLKANVSPIPTEEVHEIRSV